MRRITKTEFYSRGGFENLSPEAKQMAKNMIEFCIAHGYCMGQNEGFKNFKSGKRDPEVQELIDFVIDPKTPSEDS